MNAVERDARALVDGLTERQGSWRASPETWSVSECLDHLAIANRVYLQAMQLRCDRALQPERRRHPRALPGLLGGWFVRVIEPPVPPRFRSTAPHRIRPRHSPLLGDALDQFLTSQDEVRAFLQKYREIDLAGVRFSNPFVRGLRFSLATGLHGIAAHERRHLWQAWRVRREAEQAAAADLAS